MNPPRLMGLARMAIYLTTNDPGKLLTDFKTKIRQGHIVTWECDADGDFTHTPSQWARKAWLRPKVLSGQLALAVIKPQNTSVSRPVYAAIRAVSSRA